MDMKIAIDKSSAFAANTEKLKADLAQVEPILKLFPKLDALSNDGNGVYTITLKPIGAAGISHVVTFAAQYTVGADGWSVSFTPKRGKGNALMEGKFSFVPSGDKVTADVQIAGEINEMKIPLLMKAVVPGYVKTVFDQIVTRFLEKIAEQYAA